MSHLIAPVALPSLFAAHPQAHAERFTQESRPAYSAADSPRLEHLLLNRAAGRLLTLESLTRRVSEWETQCDCRSCTSTTGRHVRIFSGRCSAPDARRARRRLSGHPTACWTKRRSTSSSVTTVCLGLTAQLPCGRRPRRSPTLTALCRRGVGLRRLGAELSSGITPLPQEALERGVRVDVFRVGGVVQISCRRP